METSSEDDEGYFVQEFISQQPTGPEDVEFTQHHGKTLIRYPAEKRQPNNSFVAEVHSLKPT